MTPRVPKTQLQVCLGEGELMSAYKPLSRALWGNQIRAWPLELRDQLKCLSPEHSPQSPGSHPFSPAQIKLAPVHCRQRSGHPACREIL